MNVINIVYIVLFPIFLILILILKSPKFNSLNIIFSILAVTLASLLISQRTIYPEDDIVNYMNLYHDLAQGNWGLVKSFAGGLEFGFPVLLSGLSLFNITLDLNQFAFLNSLFISYLFLFVIYRIWYENYHETAISSILVISISFFSFFASTHNLRQEISSILLYYALMTTARNRYFILFLATSFHISSIIIFQFFVLINSHKRLIFLIIATIFLKFNLETILDLISSQEYFIGKEKFSALNIVIDHLTTKDKFYNLIKLILLGFLYLINKKNISKKFQPLFYFIIFGIFLYILFFQNQMPIDRIYNLLLNLFYGLFLFIILYKCRIKILIFSFIGIFYQSYLLYVYSTQF